MNGELNSEHAHRIAWTDRFAGRTYQSGEVNLSNRMAQPYGAVVNWKLAGEWRRFETVIIYSDR